MLLRLLLSLVFFILITLTTFSQKKIRIQGEKLKEKELYLQIEDGKIAYFTKKDGNPSSEIIVGKQVFSTTRNYTNIYFEWKNPLQYKFSWKDSVYTDEQQQAVKDFVKSLLPLFNIPEAEVKNNNSNELTSANEKSPTLAKGETSLVPPKNGFKDQQLTFLYIQLILGQKTLLTELERIAINKLTPKLQELDESDKSLQPEIQTAFKDLFNETDPYLVNRKDPATGKENGTVGAANGKVANWEETLKKNEIQRNSVATAIKDLEIANVLLNGYVKNTINQYVEKSGTLYKVNEQLIEKFKPVISLLQKASPPFVKAGTFPNYFKLRLVRLEEGKSLQTELAVTSYKINKEGNEVEKSVELEKTILVFKSYDPFSFSLSTGLFYGSTSLKGFGVATSTNGEMTVTEDTIKKNSAVTALFGNFNIGIGSRIFAPLIQLGIDPTKRNPFFLLGGGFSIPVANFALSAGGIWTFEPTLTKLKPGQTIKSTTELEKDIKNKFQLDPKGWYLGIQYNF